MSHHRTIILGAGAAGLMAAAHAGPGTLVLDHARKPGEKIRISGGGRCNFTNLDVTPENFLSQNPHFHKSAIARYTQWDFIDLMSRHRIAWHEKTLGQLFCDGKSTQVIDMLLAEMQAGGATLSLSTQITDVTRSDGVFKVTTETGGKTATLTTDTLVLATGGKSIPKMGASGFAYDLAQAFGHAIVPPRPALVPLTFGDRFAPLAGVSVPARAFNDRIAFVESLLFTHRGLSGPAILQLSSYWRDGDTIMLDICPPGLHSALRDRRQVQGRQALTTELARHLPARLVEYLAPTLGLTGNLADQSDARLAEITGALSRWTLTPTGSEGYRTAEVTAGGVATDGVSSQTMESKHCPGLYIIGEAMDVTGWLGGYNFQWAWASGAAAGRAIAMRR